MHGWAADVKFCSGGSRGVSTVSPLNVAEYELELSGNKNIYYSTPVNPGYANVCASASYNS